MGGAHDVIAVHVADQNRVDALQPQPLFHQFQSCVKRRRVETAAIEHQRPAAVGKQQGPIRPVGLLELE